MKKKEIKEKKLNIQNIELFSIPYYIYFFSLFFFSPFGFSLILILFRIRFTSAVLRGKDWEFPLPPFGQGW